MTRRRWLVPQHNKDSKASQQRVSEPGRDRAAAPESAAARSEPGAAHWILLVLVLCAGAGFGIVSSQPLDAAEVVIAVIAGVMALAFWWLVIGAVVWLVRRAVRRRTRFGAVMMSRWLLTGMLVLALASNIGAVLINAEEENERLAAPDAATADVEEELTSEQETIVDYINGTINCIQGVTDGRTIERRFVRALERGDVDRAARHARVQRRNLLGLRNCQTALVHASGDLQITQIGRDAASATAQLVRGWDSYIAGTRDGRISRFDHGDGLIRRGRRASRGAARALDDLYRSLDPDRLARYIDFEALLRARQRAGLQ